MDKKDRRINRIQNTAIIALTLSALILLMQTPLFGSLSDLTADRIFESLFEKPTAAENESQTTLSAFATPVHLLYSNAYAHFGKDALTVLDSDFASLSPYLSQALSSASSASPVEEDAFLQILQDVGFYCDFTADIPLSVLSASFGVSNAAQPDIAVRRLFLCPGSGSTASLYLADSSGSCYHFSTKIESADITDLLNEQSGSTAYLAALLPEEYDALSPYTLIFTEPAQRNVLSASNPLADADYYNLLRLAEFNPHTENRYTESSGTTVVRESDSSLFIETDGTVVYQGGTAEQDSLYEVHTQSDNTPTVVEATAAAQKLVNSLLKSEEVVSQLYFSEISAGNNGYSVSFDYTVNGTPIRFADGSHAASVTISGQSITAFRIHFRTYSVTDETALLLPLQQALAIAKSGFENAEPVICYVDSGADSVCPCWVAD